MALWHYGGGRSLGVTFGGKEVGLSDNRRSNIGTGWTDEEFPHLPLSSLWAMLQGEEIVASTYCCRMRQGAEAQMPLLPAPEQVQGQHNEARHTCTPEFTIPVTQLIVCRTILFIALFLLLRFEWRIIELYFDIFLINFMFASLLLQSAGQSVSYIAISERCFFLELSKNC